MTSTIPIKRVTKIRQLEPALFEVRVRLADGKAAVLALSAAAYADLARRGQELFALPAGAPPPTT